MRGIEEYAAMKQYLVCLLVGATLALGGCLDEEKSANAEVPGDPFTPPPANAAPTISGTPAATVQAGTAYAFTPNASDANGDPLTFSVTGLPAWASFNAATGRVSGTPAEANVGTSGDIVISVTDGTATTSLAAFRITVTTGTTPPPANTPPVISGVPAASVIVGTAYSFQPSASDANGDTLTFSISGMPAWASFSTSTGRLSGTPNAVGTFSNIVIGVSDGKGGSASLPAFSIQVQAPANRAPTIGGSPATNATVGTAWSFQPTASDPDGNALTFSIANRPAWASFSTSTGRLSGTPTTAATHTGIVISVSDGAAGASLPAFTITVTATANRAPTISGTPSTSVNAGSAYSFTPTASDPDGDTLAYGIANRPSWATFSTSTGRLSGTPSTSDAGTTSNIVISVSDGRGGNATLPAFSLTVNATNRAPTISGTPATTVNVGATYSFTPTASDPDSGDTIAFGIANRPSWATFDTATGRLSGTPTAADVGTTSNIVISVSDGKGGNATLPAFSITVAGTTTGSATLTWTAPTQNEDGSALTNLAGYRILYGTSAAALTQTIQVANPGLTTYVIDNLAQGTWYFAMRSYTSAGLESAQTNVVSKVVQ
ncbi:MAG: hypothetical protein NAOJABEB_00161 [Steroidobacteraceae bacterium]|nr:hypothetical protein [Steroidobacteraceae bacterium]